MTTDIAINGTIASVLPIDVRRVNETTSSVVPDDLLDLAVNSMIFKMVSL
jgi:hypothetical protein